MKNIIDARGFSCPEPVLMAQSEIKKQTDAFTVKVSSPTARDNVSSLLESKGYHTSITETNDGWDIEATRS